MSDLITFASDVQLRRQLFGDASFAHPAKMHLGLLEWLVCRYTRAGETIADPMAGVGSLMLAAMLGRNVVLSEIEPRWFETLAVARDQMLLSTLVSGTVEIFNQDARARWEYGSVDHLIFSPPYGCQVARGLVAKGILAPGMRAIADMPHKKKWQHLLANVENGPGASLMFRYGDIDGQIGHLRGRRYWQEMEQVYTQARQGLRSGGYMVLVIKDHIFKGQRIATADQTVGLCERLGFRLHERHARRVYPLSLWQRRRKERGEPIVEDEGVLVFT